MKISIVEVFEAPVERVFDVLTDVEHAADRVSGIEKIEILSEVRSGLGLRWRETRVMFGKEATEVMDVTAYERPTLWRTEARSHGMHYVTELSLKAVDANTTEVTQTFSGTALSLGAKLMTPLAMLAVGPTRKALRKDLLECKAVVEE